MELFVRKFDGFWVQSRRSVLVGGVAAGLMPGVGRVRANVVAPGSTRLAAGGEEDAVSQAFALMLGLIRQNEQNAVRAARGLSYLAVALQAAHGAWLRGGGPDAPRAVLHNGVLAGELAGVLAQAAAWVMMHFFPRSDHAMLTVWAAGFVSSPTGWSADASAQAAGAAVSEVLNRSRNDGAQVRWSPAMRPPAFVGMWQPTFPMFAVAPLEGSAPSWRPWVTPSPKRHQPPPAARPGSLQHREEVREVLTVARGLTATQKERALWWNLDAGSVTPAGVWLGLSLRMIQTDPIPLAQRLRVLRDLCVAMHDALIACWTVKLRDWSERPITSIRRELDPAFVPVVVTPGHPSYVSGHATLSAAAAQVLAAHWPTQREALWVKAEEAAMSRLWGGIHFRSDNEQGLLLGRAVGEEVVSAS